MPFPFCCICLLRKGYMRLLFNALAYFEAEEHFKDATVLEAINANGTEGLDNLCWMVATMSEQAEARRKLLGMEYEKPVSEIEIKTKLMPWGVMPLKLKAIEAIRHGLEQTDTDENEEVDLVLEEINKKKITVAESENQNT